MSDQHAALAFYYAMGEIATSWDHDHGAEGGILYCLGRAMELLGMTGPPE